MEHRKFWFVKGVKIFFFMVFAIIGSAFAVMLLWNWLIPVIFGLAVINFWQALGLLTLSKILFGFGGKRGGWGGHKRSGHWKSRMRDKWKDMNEEERAAFKEKMMNRCKNKDWRKHGATDEASETLQKDE